MASEDEALRRKIREGAEHAFELKRMALFEDLYEDFEKYLPASLLLCLEYEEPLPDDEVRLGELLGALLCFHFHGFWKLRTPNEALGLVWQEIAHGAQVKLIAATEFAQFAMKVGHDWPHLGEVCPDAVGMAFMWITHPYNEMMAKSSPSKPPQGCVEWRRLVLGVEQLNVHRVGIEFASEGSCTPAELCIDYMATIVSRLSSSPEATTSTLASNRFSKYLSRLYEAIRLLPAENTNPVTVKIRETTYELSEGRNVHLKPRPLD